MTYYNILNEAKITKAKTINTLLPDDIRKPMADKMKEKGASDREIEEYLGEDEDDVMSRSALGSSDERFAEKIDKEKMQAIMESKNIVEEYKLYLNFEIDKIVNKKQNYNKPGEELKDSTGVDSVIKDMYESLTVMGIDKARVKRYLLDTFYEISDDPKVIKKLLQLRINYNNKIISLLQKMLRINYKVLGITQEEANHYINALNSKDSKVANLNIKKVKEIVVKNKHKFVFKDRIDLRPLGFGVCFHTGRYTGMEDITKLERMIQLIMRYDVVVVGHGSDIDANSMDKIHNLIDKKERYRKNSKITFNPQEQINKIARRHNIDFEIGFHADKIISICDGDSDITERSIKRMLINTDCESVDEMRKKYYNIAKKVKLIKDGGEDYLIRRAPTNLDDEYHKVVDNAKREWSMQPVRTDKGTFSNMNELVRALIKQGFKSIYIMSCNPGHYELADDIKKTKGVRIHMGNNSILAESTIEEIDIDPFCLYENYNEDSFINSELELDFTEQKLHELALEYNIDYNNNQYLQESYEFITEHQDIINEGLLHDAWEYLKKMVKKVIAALIYLFKNAIAMVKAIFNKIRSLFTKQSDPNLEWEANKVSFISLESAQVKESDVRNYNQLKTIVLKSCASISKEINKVQNKQLQITKQTDTYIEKKCRETLSECMSVIFGDYIQI